ncbi:MAG: TetR/AcrR family transcriptional regulator C-terminal domain-containing protein [Burkholderiales bacterium]
MQVRSGSRSELSHRRGAASTRQLPLKRPPSIHARSGASPRNARFQAPSKHIVSEALKALAGFFALAMERGELRRADPHVTAAQFTALVMAEAGPRLYQADPAPLTLKQIRAMVRRGVDMFFNGAAP